MKKISIFRLLLFTFLYSLVANFAHPITPTFIQNLGLHDYMFGVAFGAMSFSNFVFSPLFGRLSNRYGSSKLLGFSFVGYGLCQYLFGISKTEFSIFIARLLAGFFISGISVNQLIYIMDNSSDDKCGNNLAIAATIQAVTSPFGFLIGGFIGDYSISLTFNLQAIGLVLIGMLYFIFLKDHELNDSSIMKLSDINPFKPFIEAKSFITVAITLFLLINLLTSFASTSYDQCFNYYIKDQFGFPSSYNGILKALVGFITLIANSTIAIYLLNKTNIFKSIIYVFIVCSLMMFGIIAIDNILIFIMINVIFFGFNAIYLPILQNMLTKFNSNNAELVGLYNSIRSLGMVIGSLIAGFIYALGPKLPFILSFIAFILVIVVSIYEYKLNEQSS